MSARNLQHSKPSQPALPLTEDKPLRRTQQVLVELKVCTALLKDWLVEVKDLIVVLTMIAFFIWAAIQLFEKLH